jgi:dihydroorotate dehydrogenase
MLAFGETLSQREASMKLRDIDFGSVLVASGTRGFFGEGYWFHRLWPIRGWYDFSGSTLVAKTTTLNLEPGKMPLSKDFPFAPKGLFPKCVWINFEDGYGLNAIGLSGPGAEAILRFGIKWGEWAKLGGPFMGSFAPGGKTSRDRLEEMISFVEMLRDRLRHFPRMRHLMGLQINISCPNTGTDPNVLIKEAKGFLDAAGTLGIPLVLKINLLVSVETIREIASHPHCDAICLANTIPFGALPERIHWDELFPHGSPLKRFGGGGLSGRPLLPLVAERVREIRMMGINTPLNVGGGILHPDDVDLLVEAGLRRGKDSIFIGSIAMLRPWWIKETIKRGHKLLDEKNKRLIA